MVKEGIRILIADDNSTDRMLLSRIVRNQGHQVIEAENGAEAVELFQQQRPEMVLMDVMMPLMNGKDAAKKIKALAGEELVPLIFLTSLTDAQSLADCLESGGDDFLSKPYNNVIIQAKIKSFSRMRDMQQILQQQRDTIATNNEHLLHEQHVAKAVFDNVAHAGCLSAPNIRYIVSPLSIFNGDVLLAARKPGGGMHVLLGDFTGHGLPAAIGAMPMAEIFYGMTSKGFALRDVLREINLKLKGILPVGFFCCAAVVDMNFDRGHAAIWMGGVPDCVLLRANGERIELKSSNLPLGVLSNEQFNDTLDDYVMEVGDRLLMWSDGILEARNADGKMFGEPRLKQVLDDSSSVDQVFDGIHRALDQFMGGSQRDDDTTLIELQMTDEQALEAYLPDLRSGPIAGPVDWHMTYRMESHTLRHFNPLPLLMHIMMEVPGLRVMGGELHTVMAELFSNAFEHGVLGLDSSLKSSPQGFMEYYRQREQKLQQLIEGYVEVRMRHDGDGHGGKLLIEFEDSGPGFDYKSLPIAEERTGSDDTQYCGRGIPLLSSICERLTYKGRGNQVEAEVHWPQATSRRE
ncbi:fused response regulator/phosphatase [Bacterioplanes sanyensis]|uniref:Fused response regulator/phosphatase n=1 Tax=Bacterioplanes sanyensis TaxID=1249553 RepID=A0A222FPY5_9GAMM|nr:SpoIIE family protein phosphatase [Bacterioplanes sanyensis]ASP40586.1 fused response regulator/phosphatase [Bacterioplanes sanyensis]